MFGMYIYIYIRNFIAIGMGYTYVYIYIYIEIGKIGTTLTFRNQDAKHISSGPRPKDKKGFGAHTKEVD